MSEKGKRKIFIGVFSLYTMVNLMLVYKINGSKEVRDNWQQVYIRNFSWIDIFISIGLLCVVYLLTNIFIKKCVPKIRKFYDTYAAGQTCSQRALLWQSFGIIFVSWFFFFLVFYPGTAMNDTIYILEKPWELSNQHPILYNLYTYGLFCLGRYLWNSNFGLALISLVQMVAMDLVLSKAILMLYKRGTAAWFCRLLAVYFAISPVFATYAFSAIKDTPFSIFLFAFLLQLYELADSNGEIFSKNGFRIEMAFNLFGIISFRNNGLFIVAGTAIVLFFAYKKYRKQLIVLFMAVSVIQRIITSMLMPDDAQSLFQEKAGIPLQQIGAVVSKGEMLTKEQEEYLYRLLPKEEWDNYAPCCSDVLKWNDRFDREYLNQTKGQFLKVWGQLLVDNPSVCMEAYILETYGIWGIETRNKEQYYIKEIYDNDFGLEHKSPLPQKIVTLVYKYYCNRFTYRYLSMGTAFWILFGVNLWLVYHRRYKIAVVTLPLWILFATLLVATPIAFCFRYGFVLAMAFPFYITLPFMKRSITGGQHDDAIH